ncbi:RNA polymerase sigma factor [Reichenbachiella versicolor]|uniref:RNA polymerase sigma factor n=1 Tax=Reichenbachiella versicolor TaxID=1821036 RepID=UPI001FE9BC39|nr:RNA polymerase sigma factor [Reichenbachiella versicolor]
MIINRTEKELIKYCLKKDRQAQKALFQQMSPLMLSVCMRYIGDRSLAEEVMLDGFMTVFQKLDTYKQEGSFEGWVRKIMVNKSLTWIRKNKSMYLEMDIEDVKVGMPLETIADQLESEDLLKLIALLPEGYRSVFNMYAIEGYNHQEIADQLGISVITSRTQLSRARKFLQNKMTNWNAVAQKKQGNGS